MLDVWVAGQPATKGSVNVGRQGQVRQAASGYASWSGAVRRCAVEFMRRKACSNDRCRCESVESGEVAMATTSYFVHGGRGLWAKGDGDGDKLDRATWDALTAAGVWQDDAQVVRWLGGRFPVAPGWTPGAHITVWAVSATEYARERNSALNAAMAAYELAMYGGRSGAAKL